MFPVRCEHHLFIKGRAIPVTDCGCPQVFPVRYDHLHIKCKAIPVRDCAGPQVFPLRYNHLHIKCKAIPVTCRGCTKGCEMLKIHHCVDNQLKIRRGWKPHAPAALHSKEQFLFLSLWQSFLLEYE
jgi:hypothetical protein